MPYADPAVQAAYLKAYYAKDKERFVTKAKEYYARHPEVWLDYRTRNIERIRPMKNASTNRRAAKLRALVAAARVSCVDCGAPPEHLHHVDPATKLFPLGAVARQSVAAVEAEIAKCVSLCQPCHVERHKQLKQKKNQTQEGE
jgi:5-methylcytosine-specific restriction endonuclease McrA